MKAKAANSKMLGVLLAILIGFISWGVASAAGYHFYGDLVNCPSAPAVDCTDCHDMHGGTSNIKLIAEEIPGYPLGWCGQEPTPTSVVFEVIPDDYADGTGARICEVCHTRTKYWLNDGTSPEGSHQVGADCISCHSHCDEFLHSAPGTGCDESGCHGHDGGAGTVQSHSTHTDDDPMGPGAMACGTCHDTNLFPYFASGIDDNEDGHIDLSETTACDPCHSPGGAFDGSVMVKAADVWKNGVYDDGSVTVDNWCASCHDADPAIIDSQTAPNIAGDNGQTYGYYVNGHGTTDPYNATLHGQNGPGYACTVCHDATLTHISATVDDPRLESVTEDPALAYTSGVSEVCLDCHLVGKTDPGSLGYDATAEASVHSGAVNDKYNTSASTAFPAYGDEADYGANPGYQCADCHSVHGTQKLAMVRPTIDGKVGGTSNPVDVVEFEADVDEDLRNLDPTTDPDDGVCDVCHASGNDPHPDTNHPANHNVGNTGDSCMVCHSHTYSFAHAGGAGPGCEPCHGTDAGGAGTVLSHSTHTEGDADDVKGPMEDCSTCHDTNNFPYFKSGTDENEDGHIDLSETNDCDACHSPLGAFPGGDDPLNDPDIGAKANWDNGIYEADGLTLKAGKEQWCATCHDDPPASSSIPYSGPLVVVDDPDATFVPDCSPGSCDRYSEWEYWNGKMPYGAGVRYMSIKSLTPGGAVDGTATWTPTIPETGQYHVYAWWDDFGGDEYRSSSVTYTIYYNDGTDSVQVTADQTANGGQWNLLDTRNFNQGSSCYVEMSNDAPAATGSSTWVVADAILFTQGPAVAEATDAPNVVGDNEDYGFYVSGHAANNEVFHCLDCHDASKEHIDHQHRTYSSSSNNYQAGYRLRSVDGGNPMEIPRVPGNPQDNWEDFAFCFDCHNRNEVLGVDMEDVSHTNFVHDEADPDTNSHYFHLSRIRVDFDSDFDGVSDSAFTCTACHNVHGSPTPMMIRHGELIKVNRDFPPDFDALNFYYLPLGSDLENSTAGFMDHGGTSVAKNGVCGACHGSGTSVRSAYMGPKVIDPKADPEAVFVPYGGEADVLITAFVLDHSDPIDVSTVTVDLSPILGGGFQAVAMYDDGDDNIDGSGTDSGDKDADDGIYSHLATIPDTALSYQYQPVVTAEDLAILTGENTFELPVEVEPEPGVPSTVIVDDPDATLVPDCAPGSCDRYSQWEYWNGKMPYGAGVRYMSIKSLTPGGAVDGTATWTPTIPGTGQYSVYAWWDDFGGDEYRSSSVTYTIYYNDGTDSVQVPADHTANGGQWNLLDTRNFNEGTSCYVEMSNDAPAATGSSTWVVADAIKFEPPINGVVVDDPDATFVPDCSPSSCDRYSQWEYWNGKMPYGAGVRYMSIKSLTPGGAVDGTATWTPTIPGTGQYNVYAWWDSFGGVEYRSSSVTYTIYYNDGTDSVQVPADHTANGGRWNLLDTRNFNQGSSCYVEMSNDAPAATGSSTWVVADAIWLEPVPVP